MVIGASLQKTANIACNKFNLINFEFILFRYSGKRNWNTWKFRIMIMLRGIKNSFQIIDGRLNMPDQPAVDAAMKRLISSEVNYRHSTSRSCSTSDSNVTHVN